MSVQYAGVSAAVQASTLDGLGRHEITGLFRDLAEQLQPELRRHVGDVGPKATPVVRISGPHSDPLQGRIYVISLAVPVETDDLPTDCSARQALVRDVPTG